MSNKTVNIDYELEQMGLFELYKLYNTLLNEFNVDQKAKLIALVKEIFGKSAQQMDDFITKFIQNIIRTIDNIKTDKNDKLELLSKFFWALQSADLIEYDAFKFAAKRCQYVERCIRKNLMHKVESHEMFWTVPILEHIDTILKGPTPARERPRTARGGKRKTQKTKKTRRIMRRNKKSRKRRK